MGGELSESLEQGMSEAERMLQEAVAALDASEMAMHEVGLRPLELRDWSGELPNLQRHSSSFPSAALSGMQRSKSCASSLGEFKSMGSS